VLSNTGFATVQNLIDPKYPPMTAAEDGQSPESCRQRSSMARRRRPSHAIGGGGFWHGMPIGTAGVAPSPGTKNFGTRCDIRAMRGSARYYAEDPWAVDLSISEGW
jgi:hypothetical protein